jgi:hypothetical protein
VVTEEGEGRQNLSARLESVGQKKQLSHDRGPSGRDSGVVGSGDGGR